jgi:hypothetical protein
MKAKLKVLAAVLCAVAAVTVAYAATSAGSSSDPLVTLSYLTDKFTPQMESKMDTLVKDKADELTEQFDTAMTSAGGSGSSSSVFQVVTLTKGKTLVGDVGCEVMLRVGTATCGADGSTGLIDTTDGTTLADGKSLVKNHLYMVTISTRSVTATADTVRVLVRGPYTIK